jgi:hypothetical protein
MSVPAKSKPPPETAKDATGLVTMNTIIARIQPGRRTKESLQIDREPSNSNLLEEANSILEIDGVRSYVTWRLCGSCLVDIGLFDFGFREENASTEREIQNKAERNPITGIFILTSASKGDDRRCLPV